MVESEAAGSAEALTVGKDGASVRVAAAAYSLSAIKKTAYRFARDLSVTIEPPAEGVIPIHLFFKGELTNAKARAMVTSFLDDLLDQQLREEIGEETKSIRALILAHAFSRAGVVGRE